MAELLKVQGLEVRFGDSRPVVQDVSFTVNEGEILGIMGASGAGKSLSAWAVTGVMPPGCMVTGNFWFRGQQMSTSRKQLGTDICVIPQNPFTSLNPAMRCGRQVREMLNGVDNGKERVIDALSKLGFEDPTRIYDAFPLELSGGQLQRVTIAMATINAPSLVIADEPTTALDTLTTRQVIETLVKWQSGGTQSLVLISHDPELLAACCQRILILQNGRTVEEVAAAELNPGSDNDLIREFMHNRPSQINLERSEISGSSLLSANGISKQFIDRRGKQIQAVDKVTFNLLQGECLALVGPTGCGKSTIARMVTGLVIHDSGEIQFRDKKIDYQDHPGLRAQIQMVFQDPYSALYPHKTVLSILNEPLLIHRTHTKSERYQRVIELLDEVQLPHEYTAKYPDELSGGERQRVQIARALAVEPELLICDECVTGLDLSVQAHILGLLHQLKTSREMTLLFISHDLSVVRSLADRVAVLDRGRIVEIGQTHQVLSDPKHVATKALLEAEMTLKV